MAIQRVGGYVYSCAGCNAVYPARRRRGEAVQDELDHHRAVDCETWSCRVLNDHRHHSLGCASSHQRAPVPE